MNPITNIFKQQEKFTQAIQSKFPKHRCRLYTPKETLSMFVSQAFNRSLFYPRILANLTLYMSKMLRFQSF